MAEVSKLQCSGLDTEASVMVQNGHGPRCSDGSSHQDGGNDRAQLQKYWEVLPMSKRRSLMHIPRRTL